jgi:hypothetical protein
LEVICSDIFTKDGKAIIYFTFEKFPSSFMSPFLLFCDQPISWKLYARNWLHGPKLFFSSEKDWAYEATTRK